jgi:hypothetical protein
MEGDEVLKNTEANNPPSGNRGPSPGNGGGNRRPMGNGPIFGKDLYYISILGKPPKKAPGCCSSEVIIWR